MMLVRGFPNRAERTHNASSTMLLRSPVSKGKKTMAPKASHSSRRILSRGFPSSRETLLAWRGLLQQEFRLDTQAAGLSPRFSEG